MFKIRGNAVVSVVPLSKYFKEEEINKLMFKNAEKLFRGFDSVK